MGSRIGGGGGVLEKGKEGEMGLVYKLKKILNK